MYRLLTRRLDTIGAELAEHTGALPGDTSALRPSGADSTAVAGDFPRADLGPGRWGV
ncbi:hypothetical protein [Streptomyces sp. CMB-StM0423]|uniref:hypothetical protein n=1 Tax=Streptomyces sp. CMB-StM0423 TaxID=2059884 RepID=UPI00131D6E28|nr:hypothetical protein [Streptomyces sp. CMB-StM0423]